MQQNDQQLNTSTEQSQMVAENPSNVDNLEGGAHATPRKKKLVKLWDIALWLVIAALVVALGIRCFVYTNITISGESMTADYYNNQALPTCNRDLTYHDGDVVGVIKTAKPTRGDVVVFYKYPIDSKFKAMFARGDDVLSGGKYEKLIKRVVAIEGDTMWIEEIADGQFRVTVLTSDGQTLREDYYQKDGETLDLEAFTINNNSPSGLGVLTGCDVEHPYIVSDGCFFAMGDNRDNSADSRILGEIPMDQLYGVVRK